MRKPLFFVLIVILFTLTAQAKTLRLSDYGTPGDSIDDSGSFQTAVNELSTNGGGTLVITEGLWDIQQGILLINPSNNATSIRISGNKGAVIRLALNQEATFLSIGNGIQAELSGLIVVSKTTGPLYDGGYFLRSANTGQTIIQNCNFFGLLMKYDFIHISNTDLVVEKCIFGGNATSGAQIHAVNFSGVTVRDSLFLDYYNFLGAYYSKTPYNIGMWIKAENDSMPGINAMGTKAVTVLNSRFDEGAPMAIYVKNAPFADIADVQVNVSSVGDATAIRLDNVQFAQVKMSQFGFTAYRKPAITATNGTTLEVSGLRFANPVYFAEVDRSTKVFKEKCAQCLELLVESNIAPGDKGAAAEKGGTVEPVMPTTKRAINQKEL